MTMKRSLIAVALVVLGLSGTAAIAEPTLGLAADESFRMVPETTSYQAASNVQSRIGEQDGVFNWNP
jgi:hypothetical protein